MKIGAFTEHFVSHGTKGTSAFHVMLAYEDYFAGRRAMDSCQLLLSKFANQSDVQTSIWRFDALEGTTTVEDAICSAIHADVIIVATYQRELPIGVRRWVDAWVPQKRGQKAALIAFVQEDNGSLVCHYLEEAAGGAGLHFFATALGEPELRIPTSSDPARDAWGLNE